MLEEQDIQKLAQVFATKAELQAAVSNLATKDDINEIMNALDAYANKADTYYQERSREVRSQEVRRKAGMVASDT